MEKFKKLIAKEPSKWLESAKRRKLENDKLSKLDLDFNKKFNPYTLHLTIKKKFFDMILAEIKLEEYREIKDHWCKKFCSKEWYKYEVEVLHNVIKLFPETITFTNGYNPKSPRLVIECKGITVGKAVPEWSDNWPGDVFVIKLGKILSTKNVKK